VLNVGAPCENLDRLDQRYRSNYGMSMVENLKENKEEWQWNSFLKNRKRNTGAVNVVMLYRFRMVNATRAYTHEWTFRFKAFEQ